MQFGTFGRIFERAKYVQVGVSEKILQNAVQHVSLRSIGPSSQKLKPISFLARPPHCNYNIKLQSDGRNRFMGL